ncbi:hypothetical protein B0H14DRAFT_3531721 [Mycena olivaceomarginata]|nr:hypothetical protein B0H14DRAFT_3531721 [Mycena olivaceomarginata]
MSGTGVTYYAEQLKYLLRLLKALPETIPIGDAHNFIGYKPNAQKKVADAGCVKTIVSHSLEISFGSRQDLTLWVDDLTEGATAAIEAAGGRVRRFAPEFESASLGEWSGDRGPDRLQAGQFGMPRPN